MNKLQTIVKENLTKIAETVSESTSEGLTDEKLIIGLGFAYQVVVPSPIKFIVKEEKFISFCMENKTELIDKINTLKDVAKQIKNEINKDT